MAYTNKTGFLIILTDIAYNSVEIIVPHVPYLTNFVSVDLKSISHSKITMSEFSQGYECSLPDQIMFNPKCKVRPSEIPYIVVNPDLYLPLNYNEVVNRQGVTKLTTVKFSDKFEISGKIKPTSHFNLKDTKRFKNRGKTMKFLEKFKDTEFISDSEKWDIIEDAIRIKNKELYKLSSLNCSTFNTNNT
jgi:hypothetical protein